MAERTRRRTKPVNYTETTKDQDDRTLEKEDLLVRGSTPMSSPPRVRRSTETDGNALSPRLADMLLAPGAAGGYGSLPSSNASKTSKRFQSQSPPLKRKPKPRDKTTTSSKLSATSNEAATSAAAQVPTTPGHRGLSANQSSVAPTPSNMPSVLNNQAPAVPQGNNCSRLLTGS